MTLNYNKDKLKDTCRRYGISLAILHGSYAKGIAARGSDIDIALLGKPDIIRQKYFDILRDFADLFGDKFDPVFLNGAEAMITYYAARDGLPLYEEAEGMFNLFRVAAFARYFDTRKFRLLEKEYIKNSIHKGE